MSRQRGRAKYSNIDLLDKYHYIGLKYLWYQHSILDQHLLYDLFPKEILPYDYKTYFENPTRFEMVTTNCVTGQALLPGRSSNTRCVCLPLQSQQFAVCLSDNLCGWHPHAGWWNC